MRKVMSVLLSFALLFGGTSAAFAEDASPVNADDGAGAALLPAPYLEYEITHYEEGPFDDGSGNFIGVHTEGETLTVWLHKAYNITGGTVELEVISDLVNYAYCAEPPQRFNKFYMETPQFDGVTRNFEERDGRYICVWENKNGGDVNIPLFSLDFQLKGHPDAVEQLFSITASDFRGSQLSELKLSVTLDGAATVDEARLGNMLNFLIGKGYPLMPDGQSLTVSYARPVSLFDKDAEELRGIYSVVYKDFDDDGECELLAVVAEPRGNSSWSGSREDFIFRIAVVEAEEVYSDTQDDVYHVYYLDDLIPSALSGYGDDGSNRSFISVVGRYIVVLNELYLEEDSGASYMVYEYTGDGDENADRFRAVAHEGFDLFSWGRRSFSSSGENTDETVADYIERVLLGEYGLENDDLFPFDPETGKYKSNDVLRGQSIFFKDVCYRGFRDRYFSVSMYDNTGSYERYAKNTVIRGDVNGDGKILADDARFALRASAQLEVLNVAQRYAADVDKDGEVHAGDARNILRRSASLPIDDEIEWTIGLFA